MHEKTERLAIISGGGGYLGSAVRNVLDASDWHVISLGQHLKESDTEYRCDITVEQDVRAAVRKITSRFGTINACIHAAAPKVDNMPLLTLRAEAFDMQMDVAARGAFLLAKVAVPHMNEGAAFIGITTKLLEPAAMLSPMGSYIPAKYALRGFLRALSAETRSKGIRVYAVAPGFLPGGLNKDLPEPVANLLAAKSGIGTASIQDTAELIRVLCTEPETFASPLSISLSPIECSKL